MKKFTLFVMVLLLASGASSAWAEKMVPHTVSKGETLWRISGVHWQSIRNADGSKLKSTTIKPDQKLLIPEKSESVAVKETASSVVKNATIRKEKREIRKSVNSNFVWNVVGGNPYKGTAEWAIDHSNLPADIRVKVMENIRQGKFEWFEKGIGSGQHFDWMTFGKAEVRENFITGWDSTLVYAAKDYGVAGYHVLHIQKCNNWGGWEEKNPPPVVTSNPPTEGPPSVGFPHPDNPFPGVTPAQIKNRNNWDWQVGAGNYRSRVEGGDNNGKYAYTKGRARFLWFDPTEKISIGIGAFGFLAGGNGVADKYYTYDWNERVFGATAKILAEHKDFDIDLGVGKLYNHGKWKGEKVTHQVDDIFLASLHGNFYARRDRGEKWFPKFETNLEARFPFNTNVKQGEKTDNQTITLMLTQWIYDFDVNGDKSLVIAPGFNFGGGVENSSKNRGFLQAGPATEFSSYSNVVAATSFANFKFQGVGQWQPFSINVSIDGVVKAVYASQIHKATAAELKGLPENGESTLLHNPADYLK